jgi:hypothetical protein
LSVGWLLAALVASFVVAASLLDLVSSKTNVAPWVAVAVVLATFVVIVAARLLYVRRQG